MSNTGSDGARRWRSIGRLRDTTPRPWKGAMTGLARRRRSVRVAVGALSALVALVAVLAIWQVVAARSSQRAQIVDGELTATRLASSSASNAVASRLQVLENLAGQPGTPALASGAQPASVQPLLTDLLRLYPVFSSFAVLDMSGNLVGEAPLWPRTSELEGSRLASFAGVAGSGHAYVTGGYLEPSGARAVTLGAPVRDAFGTFAGVLEASVPVSSLAAAMGGTHLSGGGSALLVDQTGQVLTGPAAGTRVSKRAAPVVAPALAGRTGTATGRVPGFDGNRLLAFTPVRPLRWTVVVENSQSALGGPVTAMTERLGGIGAAVVLFALAAAVALWVLLRQLGRHRDEVTAVFASVGEGLSTVDATGQVLKVNPALAQLCGRDEAAVQGRSWADAFNVYDDRGISIAWEDTVVAQAIRTHRVVASRGYALSLLRADGRRVPVAMTASPLFIDTLAPSGAVVVIRDVSREREVDQLKSSLVSTVSHELRTPLTLIQGFSELLLTRSDLDSVREHAALTQVHASSQRLGRLIDDLLSVSRIESGRVSLDAVPIDLAGPIGEVVTSFELEKQHRFVTNVPPGVRLVLADRDKTLQILTNLVSNAVKYSPPGSEVEVNARCVGNHAEIDVVDHGIGMTHEESDGIFEKFSRSTRPDVRNVAGTGLGLYITRSLVELQGGQLWVRSRPGYGSTFTFTLPMDATAVRSEHGEEEAPCEHC